MDRGGGKRENKGEKEGGVGGCRRAIPSGFLHESTFRCQSPGGIRKLCGMPLIFYPQRAVPPPTLSLC